MKVNLRIEVYFDKLNMELFRGNAQVKSFVDEVLSGGLVVFDAQNQLLVDSFVSGGDLGITLQKRESCVDEKGESVRNLDSCILFEWKCEEFFRL